MTFGRLLAEPLAAAAPASSGSVGVAIAVSAICGALLGFALLILIGQRGGVMRRVGGFISPSEVSAAAHHSLIERALGDKQARSIARSPFLDRLRVEMSVANIDFSPEQVLLATIALAILVGWLLVTTTHSPLAALLALLVPFGVNMAIGTAADRQRRAFAEQLPDNLQVVASAMRAGQTFAGALQSVVDDAPEPSRRELSRAVTDEGIGIPLADALKSVTERMKSEDFQHVAIVAALQRDTGGNTAEVVDLVAETVRERIEIRRMVRGLTAQGRLSGIILSLMPVAMLVFLSVINPSYVHPLFHTTAGLIAMGVGLGLCLTGGLVIKKIVNIEV